MAKVHLRKPAAADIAARMRLGTSAEILRMYGYVGTSSPTISHDDAAAWVGRIAAHPCAWVIEADGALAGEIRLDNINDHDRRARLAIGLLSETHLGHGIGRQAIALVLQHAFDVIHLHRVDLRVLAYNTRAIRCYQACGFRHEGTERQSALVGQDWHDDWIMAILEPEFRALA